jgi:amino acid adenylation domain-containing protein
MDSHGLTLSSLPLESGTEQAPLHVTRHGQDLPLSFAQHRSWRTDQVKPSLSHNITARLRLRGKLTRLVLLTALDRIVDRHAILRMTFRNIDGEPRQVIEPTGSCRFPLLEQKVKGWRTVEQISRQELRGGFDLFSGPLIRGRLLHVSKQEHVLLITQHPITGDAWSISVLIRELVQLYGALARGKGDPLPPLQLQYADFASGQRRHVPTEVFQSQMGFWVQHLAGAPQRLDLPTDRPRPTALSAERDRVALRLSAQLTGQLANLAQQQCVTLLVTLLSAWAVVLGRWSGQEELVIATRVPNRTHRDVEAMVGPFENTVALRVRLQGDLTSDQLLKQLQATTDEACAHREVPLAEVAEALNPACDHDCVFPVMLALEDASEAFTDVSTVQLPGLTLSDVSISGSEAQFELSMLVSKTEGGLTGRLEYASDLYERQTIERLASCWETLLKELVTDPQCPLSLLSMLTATERARIVYGFNDTEASYPRDRLIHELFEEQVHRTPDATAVVYEQQTLTYAELNEKAEQLARYLRRAGVGPDGRVALCIERSLEMLVALLGILKAGGAYVPLDPNYPTERLAYMLVDSAPAVLLTQSSLEGMLPRTAARLIVLDREWAEISRTGANDPDPALQKGRPQQLAYVIYTSGSTGRPKGVMVEHRGVVNLLNAMQQATRITDNDRLLALTTLAFDIAALEMYLPLICGACVVVVGRHATMDPVQLARVIDETAATILQATPSTWRMLIESGWTGASRNLKALCGGETLPVPLSRQLRKRVHELWNVYGPTETTIWSTIHKIDKCEEASAGQLATQPIGRPIGNTQIYVLDERLQPVPMGVGGELYIAGDGLARGYLNRPDLTAERFVEGRFGPSGNRMYRTGDRARWHANGVLEFLGRVDAQVKIHGHRIELAEIEAVLLEHSLIQQAVVIAREDTPGDRRLSAYVVGDRSVARDVSTDEVRQELRDEVVGGWETLWEETYGSRDQATGPSFTGWNSSYTGEPIPEKQMQEWLGCTLERIQALRPSKVLEIGCGVGLVLQHLAPQCAVYVGTDISAPAVEQLRRWMSRRADLQHVQLLHRSATHLQDLESGSFDTIVLNSVVQYFPDIGYLLGVLQEAVRLLGPGGRIFLGDIRHLGLLPMFHSAAQLSKAAATLSVGQLRKRIARAMMQEKELVIDPQFFPLLPGRVPGISAVDVQLKRGRAANELTRYRYDVVLHTGEPVGAETRYESLEWPTAIGSVVQLQAALQQRLWSAMRVRSIPNSRLAREAAAQRLIETSDEGLEVGVLRRRLNELQFDEVDPEELRERAQAQSYEVQVRWGTHEKEGSFEVQLLDRARADQVPRALSPLAGAVKPWSAYANDPLENSFRQRLIPQLREYLKGRLPDYMIPSAWMVLKQLPLTPNGKVDRHALPAPQGRPEEMGEYIAPRTELERTLADIWAQVLRVDQVGVQDNFFELGGHSLLIVQMMERLRRAGLSTDVRSIYASPTLADLARTLTGESAREAVVPPNRILPGCAAITPQMLPLVELEASHIEQIVQTVPGAAANIQDIYPLAPLQEGILFHHLLDEQGGGDTYVLPMLLSLSSRQKLGEFVQALQKVIDRHDVLRTAVLWEQLPRPVQVVYRQATLPVQEIPLDAGHDPLEQLKERMQPQYQNLELRQAPLMRLQVAADPHSSQWYALLQTHHLVCDNESLDMLIAEVIAHLQGHAQRLPQPMAYRNHVAQALAHARTHDSEAFFREKLAQIDEPTAPFGLLDVHGDARRIEEAHQGLEPALARRVRLQARRLGVSAATLFHAAWGLVVARTSGRDELVYGTVLLGRLHGSAGAQRILGMFINTLPLRLSLQGVTAQQLLEQTQRELIELLNHEQASLAVAKRCSGVTGSAPLFSALLNYRHSAVALETELSSATGVTVLASEGRTNYPLVLSVVDQSDRFVLEVETDRRVDPHRIVGYMNTALLSLVTALEKAPQTPAVALSILPESERDQLIETFNATASAYPQDKLVHELFEEQVERTPDAIAVVYEQQSLTYAELNDRATRLAGYLRGRGIGPDQLVGICIERSLEMVVGLLGILKAGGAYVPLDPNYPSERLAYMIADAAPRVLLTQEKLRRTLPTTNAEVIALDRDWSRIAQQPLSNPDMRALDRRSHHLAYVIYTSGSTGNPKGVMVEHAGVVNFLTAMQHSPGIRATDRLLAVTTVSFDIAALEIYLPLLNGAQVVLASRETASDARRLIWMLEEFDITVLQATPATWQLLLSAGWSGRSNLKALCGGEALTTSLSQTLVSRTEALWNLYGPTETTIWSCARQIAAVPDERGPVESIGRPIANTRVYILDPHLQPVPIGVAGEIYIGGAGVARGYLNRPELTQQRFIADPFRSDPQARMYRTGDLGRWHGDGHIEYLGRNDQQVKIRGYRIELGEIEAQLVRHAQIKEAVVLDREDVPGEKRLVAYLTHRDESGPSVEELRAQLKTVLPEHMIPSAFVFMTSFPRTPNGKLDRLALQPPELGAYASRQYEAPQGEVEEVLAALWQELLHVERVGRQDNFFELGGHSLHGVKLVAKVEERLLVRLCVIAVFRYPTIQQMGEALQSLRSAGEDPLKVASPELEEGLI